MEIIRSTLANISETNKNLSLVLGFFDGIHKGHQAVIKNAVNYAKKCGGKSAVISFSDHPLCFILNRTPEYILSLSDKISKLEALKVDYLYLIEFDKELSLFSAKEYFDTLVKLTCPCSITTGFNHNFGKDKKGDTKFLKSECEKIGIPYIKIPPVSINGKTVSSSEIRKALIRADFKTALDMLGYDFFIKGKVIKGKQIGTQLGYKTININYPQHIIKIPFGVYLTKTKIENKWYNSVTNWGVKPTISDECIPTTETYILGFDSVIYDETAEITFFEKIRDEKKFDNLNDLQTQIYKDVEFCMSKLL